MSTTGAIRNPAEVLKTQQQTGLVNSTFDAVKTAVADEGLTGLYRGYGSNVAYAFPTDAIKFVVSPFPLLLLSGGTLRLSSLTVRRTSDTGLRSTCKVTRS